MNPDEYTKILELEENNWWYRSRRRIIDNYLECTLIPSSERMILDIASAAGTNFMKFNKYGNIIGIDISEESLNICRKRDITNLVQADAMYLPFKDNTFDLVFSFDSFEHLDNDESSISRLSNIIKSCGTMIITVPAFMFLWSTHDESFHHVRRYRKNELKEKLERYGFDVEYITYWSTTFFFPVFIFRKLKNLFRDNNGEVRSDFFQNIPAGIEKVLYYIQYLESLLIKRKISLPFGVSLFCIAHRRIK